MFWNAFKFTLGVIAAVGFLAVGFLVLLAWGLA
jgi:hypothetical protein